MNVEISQSQDKVTMKIIGRLDTLTSPKFDQAASPYMTMQGIDLVLDVAKMDYVSSSGLRSFIKMLKQVNANSGKLSIVGMLPEVREIFDMTGFSSLFIMLPTLADPDSEGKFDYYYVGKKI